MGSWFLGHLQDLTFARALLDPLLRPAYVDDYCILWKETCLSGGRRGDPGGDPEVYPGLSGLIRGYPGLSDGYLSLSSHYIAKGGRIPKKQRGGRGAPPAVGGGILALSDVLFGSCSLSLACLLRCFSWFSRPGMFS